jgi:hypothetical protein
MGSPSVAVFVAGRQASTCKSKFIQAIFTLLVSISETLNDIQLNKSAVNDAKMFITFAKKKMCIVKLK